MGKEVEISGKKYDFGEDEVEYYDYDDDYYPELTGCSCPHLTDEHGVNDNEGCLIENCPCEGYQY